MPASDRFAASFTRRPLALILMMFVVVLWIAGGSSKDNVIGQAVVRAVSWLCLIGALLFDDKRPLMARGRPILIMLAAATLLAAAQIIPLPPGLWIQLPGRAAFADAAALAGGPSPWRPLAIVPSAAENALASLIVPFAMLYLASRGERIGDGLLVKALLGLVVASMFVGLLQFSGMSLYDPLVNRGDDVVGTFGNRNHFALLMASGLLLAPVWAFFDGRQPGWRGPVVIALIPLLTLSILASGSRAGMLAGMVATGCALHIVYRPLRKALARGPRWIFPALIVGTVVMVGGLVMLSIAADRAVSINRALALDPSQDMRSRGLPTILAMIKDYMPVGAGLGGFDQMFRLHEPFDLLKLTYFNRAHNDILEIVLDTGIVGGALLLTAVGWWCLMSARAWRRQMENPTSGHVATTSEIMLPKLGSALLLIVLLASIVDYPARTPIIMALIVVAGVWLNMAGRRSPLPSKPQPL